MLELDQIPNGYDEIIEVFGDPLKKDFVGNLQMVKFPYPLYYLDKPVTRGTCHYKVVGNIQAALTNVKERGLSHYVQNYGGIYAQRSIRGHAGYLSTHSWGIAIDLEPTLYPPGSDSRFPDEVIACFTEVGFVYGGDFRRKDPMHFQLASGY